jgi:hypothetical protein
LKLYYNLQRNTEWEIAPIFTLCRLSSTVKKETDTSAVVVVTPITSNTNINNITAPVYACNLCPKSFRRPDYLNDHRINTHENKNPTTPPSSGEKTKQQLNKASFSCSLCTKTFGSEKNLARHHEAYHVAGRKFRCPAAGCDKTYPERSSLMRHLRTHLRPGGEGGANNRKGVDYYGESSESEGGETTRRKRGEPNTGPPFKVRFFLYIPFYSISTIPYVRQCCGSGMFILDPDFYPSRISDPGSNNSNKRGAGKKLFVLPVPFL